MWICIFQCVICESFSFCFWFFFTHDVDLFQIFSLLKFCVICFEENFRLEEKKMHDPNDSSILSASPNRLLNINTSKLNRQQNLTKKFKVNHTNGLRPTSQEGNSTIRSSKSETSLRCPLRQTLPIFKQPVTYYPKQRDEVKPQLINSSGGKPSEKTKPRQLFWEKRFQNIRPTDIDGQPFEHFQLPEQIKSMFQ